MIYSILCHKLAQWCTQHQLDPHFFQMWWLGLKHYNHDHHHDHTIDLYLPIFHPIFTDQALLRWKQLFYRQTTKQWTHYLVSTNPKINATKFLAQML